MSNVRKVKVVITESEAVRLPIQDYCRIAFLILKFIKQIWFGCPY
jgi:hypothetical protein